VNQCFRLSLLVAFISLFSFSNLDAQRKIQWRTWEEVEKLQQKEPRKIFVDVYTTWCGWCKKMDKATFQQDHIAKYINENFYAIKFDAEYKPDIKFNGKTYKLVKSGKRSYNQLAVEITRGNLSFPTVVFLDENNTLIQPIPGFLNSDTFEMIATFFAENHFKDTPWKRYTATYKKNTLRSIPVKN